MSKLESFLCFLIKLFPKVFVKKTGFFENSQCLRKFFFLFEATSVGENKSQ